MSSLRSKINHTLLSFSFLGFLAAVAPGCGGIDNLDGDATYDDVSDELGQVEQATCSNGDGVNSAMAALAVATAKELKRWQSSKDFYIDSNYRLALTSTGKSQCADGKCWNTQAVLDLQKATFNTVKFGSVLFNADNFRSRLYSEFNEQKICESRAGAVGSNCPAELHKLTFKSAAAGACDTLFTFTATTPTGGALTSPSLLKNKLIYVGYPENAYLAFSSTGTTATIDPTYGLNDTGTTSSGSCVAACTKMSSADVTGSCCACNGATKKFGKSAWSTTTFICQ
jgi:hypothetical protein